MKKLLLVRNEEKAKELRSVMGEEWDVFGWQMQLCGRRFDHIIIVDQFLTQENVDRYVGYINELKRHLSPGGKLVELY